MRPQRLSYAALAMVLATATLAPAPVGAQATPFNCGTGTLKDVRVEVETIATTTVSTARTKVKKSGKIETVTVHSPGERREKTYVLEVHLNGMLYTAESSGDAPWNFNPTRLVINDEIPACADQKKLTLRRPDGKDYKLKIVRVARELSSSTSR